MKLLWDLYRAFFTIGALTFGGGYAMLPMLEREIVNKHKWSTQEELLNYFAIGQCTPGIIAVNTATFVGHKVKGVAFHRSCELGCRCICTHNPFIIPLLFGSSIQKMGSE